MPIFTLAISKYGFSTLRNMAYFLLEYSTSSNFRVHSFHRLGLIPMTKNECILAAFSEIVEYVRTPMAVKVGIVSKWLASVARYLY